MAKTKRQTPSASKSECKSTGPRTVGELNDLLDAAVRDEWQEGGPGGRFVGPPPPRVPAQACGPRLTRLERILEIESAQGSRATARVEPLFDAVFGDTRQPETLDAEEHGLWCFALEFLGLVLAREMRDPAAYDTHTRALENVRIRVPKPGPLRRVPNEERPEIFRNAGVLVQKTDCGTERVTLGFKRDVDKHGRYDRGPRKTKVLDLLRDFETTLESVREVTEAAPQEEEMLVSLQRLGRVDTAWVDRCRRALREFRKGGLDPTPTKIAHRMKAIEYCEAGLSARRPSDRTVEGWVAEARSAGLLPSRSKSRN